MATFTITIPDNRLARIRTAFGRGGLDPRDPWVPATQAQIEAWLWNQIKQRVQDYEGDRDATAVRLQVQSDVGTW